MRPAILRAGQRGFEIALRDLHIADILIADRAIALPARIAGV